MRREEITTWKGRGAALISTDMRAETNRMARNNCQVYLFLSVKSFIPRAHPHCPQILARA